jgi:hypothetical protein
MVDSLESGKGKLALLVANLREEFGGDKDLVKQGLADFNALDRQIQQQVFEAEHQNRQQALESRKEYARQVGESNRERETALKEYGMQTLKWAFVMNAGAAGLLLGYIGTRIGVGNTSLQTYLPLLKATIPFATGCVLVTVAGLAAYANFSYASQALPSVEAMFNFFNISRSLSEWPRPKGAPLEADLKTFSSQNNRKLNCSRRIAVGCGIGAIACFAGGISLVFFVLL